MKSIAALALSCAAVAFAADTKPQEAPKPAPPLRSVYIMPMNGGLDQYLANRLTNLRVARVVADPKRADAVISDQIGEQFQSKLADLYPEPKPEPEPKAKKTKDDDEDEADRPSMTMAPPPPPPVSSFHRGKGTVFVVDAQSRAVIWSIYAPAKKSTAKEMDVVARKVAEHLKKHWRHEAK